MAHDTTIRSRAGRLASRVVLVAMVATVLAVVPSSSASAVTVGMTGHVVIHSAVVDEAETQLAYDLEYVLDSFGRDGGGEIVIYRGDGLVLHRGWVQPGGSFRFSGVVNLGSWSATPEQMATFRVRVYQAVGYPATIYDAYDAIDVGWRSAPPSGQVSIRDLYASGERLFYDLDVVVKSPGGSADEPCAYLAPYGYCWVRPALVSPAGEILSIYAGAQVLSAGNRLTNLGTQGIDISGAPEGSSLQVFIVGTMLTSPNRYYPLDAIALPGGLSEGIDLRSTPLQVKRNTENVTLVASLAGPLADFGAVEPGIAIIDQDLGIVVGACPGERVCNALIPFVEETPHSFAAIVADFADPENLVAAPETPSDVLVLPNVGGPSDYELNGGYIPSAECNTSSVADPVNTATGEFFERSRDLAMPCVGPPVGFERTYSTSTSGEVGALGYGWRHNFEMSIEPVGAETFEDALAVDVVQENGSRVRFFGTTAYGFDAPSRVRATLDYNDDGTWTYVRDRDATFTFDAGGSLVALHDKNGNAVHLAYVDGRLSQVADDFGRSLTVTWTGDQISAVTDQAGRTVTYTYNARGDLVTATDYGGVAERYRYDTSHRLTRLIAASGVETVNTYDAEGRVATQSSSDGQNFEFTYQPTSTTVVGPTGLVTVEHYMDNMLQSSTSGVGTTYEATTHYEYDERNNVSAISDAYGNRSLFQYEGGRKTSAQDPLGNQRRWIYNAAGNLIQTVNPRGTVEVTYEYDDRDNLIAERHADGRTILYTNDERGLITRVDGPGANSEAYTYNSHGDRVRVEYANGATSEFEYDTLGRPVLERKFWDRDGDGVDEIDVSAITYNDRSQITSTTGPRGDTTSSTFDARGRIRSVTDAAGSVRRTTYDELGRVATQSDTLRNVTSFGYDGVGHLTTTTLPNGGQIAYEYDARGLITAETDPLGRITHHEYDLNGRRVATTDGAGRRTSWTYDAAGRQSTQTAPDGAVTRFEYDAFGELSASIDPEGRRTTYTRDSLGRVVTLQRPDGATWTYTYDEFGVVSEKDWLGRTLLRTRDDLGRVVSTVDFNGHAQSTTYRDGLAATTTSPSGVMSSYVYDADGRVTQVSYSNGRVDSSFAYNSRGWLTEAVDDGGRVRYVYDREGRLKTVGGRLGRTVYGRDVMGNVTSMTYPSGLVVSYEYDAANELVAASLGSSTVVNNTFDGSGLLSTMSFGNGVETAIGRASTGAVTSIDSADAAASELFAAAYGYDKSSLLTSAEYSYGGSAVPSLALGRDAMGRVNSVTTAGAGAAAVTYRPSHEAVLLDTGTTVAFDSMGVPSSFTTAQAESVTLTYDSLGRRAGEVTAEGVATGSYTFDEFDRLTDMTVDGDRHRYRYAQGLRVSDRDVSEQSTTVFRWDVSGEVSRLLEDGEHAYIYGLGTSPVAQVDIATGDIEYLHGDLVGSTRVVSDASGDVVSSFEYSAYGEITASTGDAGATQYLFAGEYRDPTGLYYLRARYLDTRIGQFLSLDPMGTVTGMPYAYTAGDPFMQTDPLGLFSIGPVNVSDWFSGAAEAGRQRLDGMAQQYNPWMWDDMLRAFKCGAESQGAGFGGWFTQLNVQANPMYAYLDGAHMFRQGVADGNWYDAGYGGTNAAMGLADTALIAVGGAGLASKVTSAFKKAPAVSNSSTALVKYDADFAVGQLTAAGRATASQLDEFGVNQGWVRSQTPAGPIKYTDANGIVRITIKQGTSRAPGSSGPHVEIRNVDGVRVDPLGNPVTRKSPGNHTPIDWDL